MVEMIEDRMPMHVIEIITLDKNGKLRGGHRADFNNNREGLPFKSVGRIYTSISGGTGFLFNSYSRGLVVLSVKHIWRCSFDRSDPENCFITFEPNHNYKIDKEQPNHDDHPIYRRLHYMDMDFSTLGSQHDPISGFLYSIPNDITIFTIENICLCGKNVDPIMEPPLEFADIGHCENLHCTLLGYPGGFNFSTSAPLKIHISSNEKKTIEKGMIENVLAWTEGKIIKSNDLMAISNSSAGRMSGGPVLVKENGVWRVIGILIGGPAALGHYELMNLAEICMDKHSFHTLLDELEQSAIENEIGYIERLARNLHAQGNESQDYCISTLEHRYYRILRETCNEITQKYGEKKTAQLFNHNLVIPIKPYLPNL